MMRNKERVNDASVDNEVDELEGIKEEKDGNGDGGTLSHLFFYDHRNNKKVAKKNMTIPFVHRPAL